ncbi:hypothetical protein CLV98_10943 [Dyadobacter jejuensis]|uniref:Uncharacterized protein n=1 Tax=Dyadobacter jejuensis TaxID=1082580 RepID=A0A316AIY0_9BACT|nr:hypothetical protein [Dyadobacter jejuensis]PWJ56934.1 hypothetical protein CLV98_10943 [Dyadobacter jejuensis]
MSDVRKCPTCSGKAKYSEKNGEITYSAIEDEEAFKKIVQLKKALANFTEKIKTLEAEVETLRQGQSA